MLTITYETLYASDKEYIVSLSKNGRTRRVSLFCPGHQYLPSIMSLFQERGFYATIVEER